MKIAVYTIALNESQFLKRWADSARAADCLLIADTGSTDKSLQIALDNHFDQRPHGLGTSKYKFYNISIQPWRFDLARNAALALLPADIDVCVTLDMDEILTLGWREEIERVWVPGTTRLRYGYVWNWNDDGTPCTKFIADRTHARAGFHWRSPVHECVTPQHGTVERYATTTMDLIHHHADDSKSRSSYFKLLELAVAENPTDDRAAHYLGREYHNMGDHVKAIAELQRHLALPTAKWNEERSASWRYLGRMYWHHGLTERADSAFEMAVRETPESRDAWHEKACHHRNRKQWVEGVHCIRQALRYTERPTHYLVHLPAWGSEPYDVGSVCAHYAGAAELAREWWLEAVKLAPTDERIAANGDFIMGAAAE